MTNFILLSYVSDFSRISFIANLEFTSTCYFSGPVAANMSVAKRLLIEYTISLSLKTNLENKKGHEVYLHVLNMLYRIIGLLCFLLVVLLLLELCRK